MSKKEEEEEAEMLIVRERDKPIEEHAGLEVFFVWTLRRSFSLERISRKRLKQKLFKFNFFSFLFSCTLNLVLWLSWPKLAVKLEPSLPCPTENRENPP